MLTITEFISKEKINIDTTTFDLIYDIIINREWVYISKEMVVEWLGYKESKNTMSDFYKRLVKDYKNNIDFKEVDKNDEIVNSVILKFKYNIDCDIKIGNRAKYYLLTNKTLVSLLMKSKNIKSLRIAEHFYYIYDLMFKYYEYQSEQLKLEYTLELDKIKNLVHSKEHTITQNIKYKILEEQSEFGFVYFIYEDEDKNYFKIGFTTNDLDSRLITLQSGNRRILKIYKFIKCKNPNELEQIIHVEFTKYKILNEWYKITTTDIDNYITNYELVELTNALVI